MMELAENSKGYKIALLVSIACVLQISESFIPHPIPGLRLGLANMLTLVALVTLGFRSALEIAILRTILSAFIMGTFMSPTFILSFSAAIMSTLVMGILYWLSGFHRRYRLSIIGISIFGALSHNMLQLYLAYLILVKHGGIFMFLPWLCIGGVVMGLITGLVARSVCSRLKESQNQEAKGSPTQQDSSYAAGPKHFVPGTSLLHRLRAETKISALLILSLLLLIFSNLWLCLGLFLLVAGIIVFSRTSVVFLLSSIRKYWLLVVVAFSFPLFFNSGNHALFHIAYFQITFEGLSTGALFSFRILFLILASTLLVRTTSPEEMTHGFARMLSPLRYFGISERRVATTLTLSWKAMPFCWEAVRRAIRASNVNSAKNLRNLIPALSHLIATLYVEAAPDSACWESACTRKKEPLGPPQREP